MHLPYFFCVSVWRFVSELLSFPLHCVVGGSAELLSTLVFITFPCNGKKECQIAPHISVLTLPSSMFLSGENHKKSFKFVWSTVSCLLSGTSQCIWLERPGPLCAQWNLLCRHNILIHIFGTASKILNTKSCMSITCCTNSVDLAGGCYCCKANRADSVLYWLKAAFLLTRTWKIQ